MTDLPDNKTSPLPYLPQSITEPERAFGGRPDLLPAWNAIPEDWRSDRSDDPRARRYRRLVSQWFFRGLPAEIEFYMVEGIDGETAFRHLSAIMGSFAPKHEHKEAAVAYLLNLWTTDVTGWETPEDPS